MNPLLTDEPTLSRLGLGTSRFGSFNNAQPLRESVRLIQSAIDLGVTVIDTSNIYGQGDSERAVGRALGGIRDRAFVVTKGGRHFSTRARALRWAKPVVRPALAMRARGPSVSARRSEEMRADWSPAALTRSLEQSLRRLRTDAVDGFILHSPPAEVAANPLTEDVLARIKAAGKARHVGVSCDDPQTLAAALTLPVVTILELPADMMVSAADHAAAIIDRRIIMLVREVIRNRSDLSPADAVRTVLDDPLTHCALVGTTRLSHLAEIVAGSN